MKNRTHFFTAAIFAGAAIFPTATLAQYTWIGNSADQTNGLWSTPGNWSPAAIPNGSSVDVTVPWRPGGSIFNGPLLDLTVQLHNLTLVNRALISTQDMQPHANLTVLGTTSLSVSPDRPGEHGILSNSGGTFTLGNLSNYNAATKTLESGGIAVGQGGVTQWNNADIVTNNGFIFMADGNSRIQRQQDSFDALTNFAVNNGSLQFVNGFNFTSSGDFTNNGGIGLGGFDAIPTTFTVSGNLTNYDPDTGTLSGGGNIVLTGRAFNGQLAAAIFRFANADIRALADNARIELRGDGHVQDLQGNDAFRNLSLLSNGANFVSSGTMTITPDGGTFTNDGAEHSVEPGSQLAINGDHHVMNGGVLKIGAPTDSNNTRVTITGNALLEGGGFDFGGQPGVNTQYHTELEVMNGIEFRGAYLTGTGTTFADVAAIQGSVFEPGHSAGELTFVGNVTLDNTATNKIEIGGLVRGTEFDAITQTGNTHTIDLGCSRLELFLINGFQNLIQQSDSFAIITSETDIIGEFANVAAGARVGAHNGSFVVNYGAGSANPQAVVVNDFIPIRITKISRQPGKIIIEGTGAPLTTQSIAARQNLTDTPVQIGFVEVGEDGTFIFEDAVPNPLPGGSRKFYGFYFEDTSPGSCTDVRPAKALR